MRAALQAVTDIMSKIFISYRRRDSPGFAGRICDHVSLRFGNDAVFRDVETLEGGVDFVEAINKAVGDCAALILVVGPNWLHVTDARGKRRLDNPDDFVRMELAVALARKIRVIPVLVEGAQMPSADELPDDLRAVTRRQAIEVTDSRFESEIEEVIRALESVLGRPSEPVREVRPSPVDVRLPKQVPNVAELEVDTENRERIGVRPRPGSHRLLFFIGVAGAFMVVTAGGLALIHARRSEGLVVPSVPSRAVAVASPSIPVHRPSFSAPPSPSHATPAREPSARSTQSPPGQLVLASPQASAADATRQSQTKRGAVGRRSRAMDRGSGETQHPPSAQYGDPQWPTSAARLPPAQWPPPDLAASDAPSQERHSSFRDRIKRAVEKW
jgi:TIR domain